jgi:murein DD-endopeptidase MepM/ murein hydrolase activator NlpD
VEESPTDKKKRTLWERLTAPYRLVLLNDETFEEVTSFRLTRMNVYILASTIFVILVLVTVSAIVYTPMKEYIPGYADVNMRRDVMNLKMQSDSLSRALQSNELYIQNIRRIITGDIPTSSLLDTTAQAPVRYDSINLDELTESEKEFRQKVEDEERFKVSSKTAWRNENSSVSGFHFFPPVKGYLTDTFDYRKKHFGVDIVAPQNEPIKAALDGIVVFSGWMVETGYVIALQHRGNLLSIYKHNSVLLKPQGSQVRAGDVIAIIGNTGELTTGPHLHFELWYNGLPLNPTEYLVFN